MTDNNVFDDPSYDPNTFWHQLSERVNLDREALNRKPKSELDLIILNAQVLYNNAIEAEKNGNLLLGRNYYKRTFELLPTHIEALDNYAIGLVEEHRFLDAIPYFEQSAVADCSSPLSFVYLVKCYRESESKLKALACVKFMQHQWPDKSPFVDWSHLKVKKIFDNANKEH